MTPGIAKPKLLSKLVAEHLKEAIVDTRLKLGEALSEEKIAASLNVSRTPVREALNILQAQGLIDIIPQTGSFVFLPSGKDIAELAEYRIMLEKEGASLALSRAADDTIAEMKKAFSLMEKARKAKNAVAYAKADNLFHMACFNNCQNSYVRDAYDAVSGRIAALRCHLAGPLKLYQTKTFEEHAAIIDAMSSRKIPLLLALIEKHINGMQANYIAAIEGGLLPYPVVRGRSKGPRANASTRSVRSLNVG
jgi:DNA-binding GntR family transcriptional regulator